MTLLNPKKYYSRFLKGHEGKLHFAAHSHHFWPDVSREGHMKYWDDCANCSDEKWSKIFSEVIPSAQTHIARMLKLKDHKQIVFAPNTHELSARLLSLFLGKKNLRLLTTSSEFHSWRRQFLRVSELDGVSVDQVETKDFLTDRRKFLEDFKEKMKSSYDLIFLSQVFFDSGLAFTSQDLKELVDLAPPETLFVVDGYHGFGALPIDLSSLEGRIFYLAGGYKYAQAGEGAGFMVVPQGKWRPAYTGWFAEYAELSRPSGTQVGYSDDAMAFMGATQDFSGLYRFNAVWNQFNHDGVNLESIHAYVRGLQLLFLEKLPEELTQNWNLRALFSSSLEWHGHFLTFEALSISEAEEFQNTLLKNHIIIDRRGTRLRFGFGLYQNEEDVTELCRRLEKLAEKTL